MANRFAYPHDFKRHFKEFIIRAATVEDASEIYRLTRALAEYEDKLDDVIVTEEDIRNDGFGENPLYGCIFAEKESDHEIVGMATYYRAYSTWSGKAFFLEDLFVMPDYRRKGLGTALFETCSYISKRLNCQQFQFTVMDWNKPAQDLYLKVGCTYMKEKYIYRQKLECRDEIAEKIEEELNKNKI